MYTIEESTLTAIADAIRDRSVVSDETYTPVEMATAIENMPNVCGNFQGELNVEINKSEWVRPSNWPDLDSLGLTGSGDDYIYMTWDCTGDDPFISCYCSTLSGNWTLERGHITNGSFVVDETHSITSASAYKENLTCGGYPIFRVTAAGGIRVFFLTAAIENESGYRRIPYSNPMVERISYLPHVTQLYSSSNATWTSYYLEREVLYGGQSLTTLINAWLHSISLRSLDVSNIDTSNVTTFYQMLYNCRYLDAIDVSNFDTSKATSMTSMFSNCINIKSLDLRNFDTSRVTSLGAMFSECRSLKTILGLENFDTSSVTNFATLFNGCISLQDLSGIKNWDISSSSGSLSQTFMSCRSVKYIPVENWNVSNITNIYYTFGDCCNLVHLDLSSWNCTISSVSSAYTFVNDYSLQELDLRGIDFCNTTSLYEIFDGCYCLKKIQFTPEYLNLANCTSVGYMFRYCYSLTEISGLSQLKIPNVISMQSSFANCKSLQEIDLSELETSNKLTTINSMFYNCNNLKYIYGLENITIDNCTDLNTCFYQCWSLQNVNGIENWNVTNKCKNISDMFFCNHSLEAVPTLNWDVSNCTSLNGMFYQTFALKTISLPNWDVSNITDFRNAFQYTGAEYINITGWNPSKASSSQVSTFITYAYNLKYFTGIAFKYNFSIEHSYMLTHDSLINIINALPTVTAARTLTLGDINLRKLTDEEIAVAEAKNWTLA